MMAANWIKSTSAMMRVRALAMLVVVAVGGVAMAQNVVVFVNGDPITAIDIEQRSKFLMMTGQKQPPRQEVLDQLIDEKLKVREGKRWGMDIPNSEVDGNYARMARGMGKSPEQLTQKLAQKGINASTLKARIRADIVWQQLVRGRYQSRLQVNDQDVVIRAGRQGRGRLRIPLAPHPVPGAARRARRDL